MSARAMLVCLVCLLTFAAAKARENPPNIVFILADDLGAGDLGCYGHPYAKTPSIDKLASEGMRFEQFYVSGPTCTPSRAGFMTGRNPARFGAKLRDHGFGGATTITKLLHQHGYTVGHFGKWGIAKGRGATKRRLRHRPGRNHWPQQNEGRRSGREAVRCGNPVHRSESYWSFLCEYMGPHNA